MEGAGQQEDIVAGVRWHSADLAGEIGAKAADGGQLKNCRGGCRGGLRCSE